MPFDFVLGQGNFSDLIKTGFVQQEDFGSITGDQSVLFKFSQHSADNVTGGPDFGCDFILRPVVSAGYFPVGQMNDEPCQTGPNRIQGEAGDLSVRLPIRPANCCSIWVEKSG